MATGKAPGSGLWGWLGRQAGYLKTAVKHDPAKPVIPKREASAGPAEAPPPDQTQGPGGSAKPQAAKPESPAVLYRTDQVEEVPHPTDPKLKLRRTVIDEVIVDKKES